MDDEQLAGAARPSESRSSYTADRASQIHQMAQLGKEIRESGVRRRRSGSAGSAEWSNPEARRRVYQTRLAKPMPVVAGFSKSKSWRDGNLALQLLAKPWFDVAMGVLIGVNSLTMGVEQHFRIHNETDSIVYEIVDVLEHVFLAIYIVELSLRFQAFGAACLKDAWVVFDFVLVLVGVLTSWILVPLGRNMGDDKPFSYVMLMRTGRVFRLARTVKLLVKFRVLWMLLQGLLSSAYTMMYTLIVLGIMLYLFACVAMEIIRLHPDIVGNADVPFEDLVLELFANLPVGMLTLLQFAMQDNVTSVYPLMQHSWYFAFYFVCVVIVVSMVLMNLLTAVIVNNAFQQAAEDKDAALHYADIKKLKLLQDLRKMFKELDTDGSGTLTREEILRIQPDALRILEELTRETDPLHIFDALDLGSWGEVSIEEFCDGIMHIACSGTSIEVKRIQKQVGLMRERLRETEEFEVQLTRYFNDVQGFQASVVKALGSADFAKKKSIGGAATKTSGLLRESICSKPGGDATAAAEWKAVCVQAVAHYLGSGSSSWCGGKRREVPLRRRPAPRRMSTGSIEPVINPNSSAKMSIDMTAQGARRRSQGEAAADAPEIFSSEDARAFLLRL